MYIGQDFLGLNLGLALVGEASLRMNPRPVQEVGVTVALFSCATHCP